MKTEVKIQLLAERISIVNAKFLNEDGPHVAFDIAVDGKVVYSTLEWLDVSLDLVSSDDHLSANTEFRGVIADALGEDREHYEEVSLDARSGVLGDIAEVVQDKLADAVADLREELEAA